MLDVSESWAVGLGLVQPGHLATWQWKNHMNSPFNHVNPCINPSKSTIYRRFHGNERAQNLHVGLTEVDQRL